jgi:hypothetical protein
MSGFRTFQRVLGFLILFSGICQGLNGQSRQVSLAREFVDSTAVHKGSIIHINSQKANISIRGWSRSTIVVRIKVTFEHADGNLARKELEYAKFNLLRTSEGMDANNYFSLPAGTSKIYSKVRVEYTVFVPDEVNLVVNNTYGTCEISNLKTFINLNNKYGEVRMSGVSGLLRIYTTLCHVAADNLGGEISFTGVNSDYQLENMNGQVKIMNNVGSLEVSPGESLLALTINATHSEVILHIKDIDRYGYSLAAKSAAVILPQGFYKHKFKERTESKAISAMVAGKTLITVNTSFNNINLK